MIFGLPEAEEENLDSAVGEILQELGEKPKVEASRLGTQPNSTAASRPRPVKLTLSSAVAASQILAKARRLRDSAKHRSVFICQDRSPADRAQHRLLVEELKKNRTADPSKRYYIKGGVICEGGLNRGNT